MSAATTVPCQSVRVFSRPPASRAPPFSIRNHDRPPRSSTHSLQPARLLTEIPGSNYCATDTRLAGCALALEGSARPDIGQLTARFSSLSAHLCPALSTFSLRLRPLTETDADLRRPSAREPTPLSKVRPCPISRTSETEDRASLLTLLSLFACKLRCG